MKNFILPQKSLFWILLFFGITTIQSSLAQTFTFNTAQVIEDDNSKLKYGLQGIVKTQKDLKAGINTNNNQLSTFDNSLYAIQGDSLLIDAIAENEAVEMVEDLKKNSIKIIASYGKISTCWVSFEQLALFETIKTCRWVQPTMGSVNHAGIVQTQGDSAQRSGIARRITGLNGTGVKIGVISDSYNNKSGANLGISNGELPGIGNPSGLVTPVTVLKENALTSSGVLIGTDEGRAMLELVHDVAPNAELYFYTGKYGKADFATGVTALADAGCKVIIDDIGYYDESFFQDDIGGISINNAKINKGVSYFSSAGNSKNLSYENSFIQSALGSTINSELLHNFNSSGSNETIAVPFTVFRDANNKGSIVLSLQWNQPFKSLGGAGATSDLNMYVGELQNNVIVPLNLSVGKTNNIGIDPVESIGLSLSNMTSDLTFYLFISKRVGINPSKIKLIYNDGKIAFNSGTLSNFISATCYGHANADGAIAVGAANFNRTPDYNVNPPLVASYSSYGGVPILFNQSGTTVTPIIRNKPEIVAPDGGNTSFFGQAFNDGDSFLNFFGTSAAAPHAGAVAALMLQAKPTAMPDDIKTALINSCTDMGTAGFDFITGNGLIKADAAILSLYSVSASVTNATQCRGINFSVNFSTVGTFGVGNIYKIQLSDAAGSFSTPVDIGTFTSTANSGIITALIPMSTATGSYKIRLISSKPNKISPDISITIIGVLAQPSTFTTSLSAVCQGQNAVIYTVPTVAGATSYTWTYSGTGVPTTSTSNSITLNFSSTATSGILNVVANNTCGPSTARTLSITVNSLPPIPDNFTAATATVCQGQNNVTYTVPAVAGGTSYSWSYSGAGVSPITGTGRTITISFSNTATSGTLSVYAVNACGNGSPRTYPITVNPLLPQPGNFTASTTTVCQGASNITYTVPTVAGATSYTWSYSGTGVPTISTSNSITLNFSPTATSGVLSVVANNACGASLARTLAINVADIPAQPSAFISSITNVCRGANNIIYTVPVVAGATNYTWTYSATGASFSSTSNTVSVSFSAAATSGNLSVVANNACGTSPARTLAITINDVPAQPSTFTSYSNNVCRGSNNVIYTVPVVAGATSYTWSYSETGASFSSTSNTVSVSFSTTAFSGNLSVVANNACGASPARSMAINLDNIPVQPSAFTNSSTTVCRGENNVIYTIPLVVEAISYTWTYSGTGASFSSTSNTVSVSFSATATSGNLSVVANNICGTSPARTLAINVADIPAQPSPFTSSTTNVCRGANNIIYTVPVVSGATNYTWTYSVTGASFSSTSNTVSVNFSSNATSGSLNVVAVNACGNSVARTLAITIDTPPTTPTSNQSGNWSNISTWKCGFVPTIALDAIISAGNTITIDGVSVEIRKLVNNGGILNFLNNGSLKLNP